MASEVGSSEQALEDPMEAECGQVVKLLVSDLDPDATEQVVEGYFESRMVEVVGVSPPSERKCIVSVTKLKDVEKFCTKNHKIKKSPVKIELLPEPVEVNDPDTIEVVYPPDAFDQDTLEAYFNGPKSGEREDGEDKSIEWAKIIEPGKCRIKFELSEDAACVLAKKSHTFMKKEVIVSPVSLSLPVKVNLVTPPTKPEFPQHVKPTQDKPPDMPELINAEESTITTPTVSEGDQLTTSITPDVVPVEDGSPIKDNAEYEKDKLLIRDIPVKATNEEYLKYYLEDTLELEREGNYSFELKENSALLTFTTQYTVEELESFCKRIANQKMKQGQFASAELCKVDPHTVAVADTTTNGPVAIVPSKKERSLDDKYERNKLIIRNIPESAANDEYLKYYLEDTLELECEGNYSFELKENSALLYFAKQYTVEELESFCKKIASHKMKQGQFAASAELCKVDLHKVVVADSSTDTADVPSAKEERSMDDEYEKNKLIIRNIPEKASTNEFLKYYLEEALELEESEDSYSFELKENSALLTFTKANTSEELKSFCEKITNRKMKGQFASAELCRVDRGAKSTEEGSSMDGQYEGNKLIIKNIPEGVDDAYLEVFLGGALDFESEDCFSVELNKTNALLIFAKEYSIEELNSFCESISSAPLNGQVLVVELCRTNCTVFITEITKESFASQNGLKTYFGNKRSGGGRDQVEDVVMLGRKKAKVTFKSSQTVASVLSKDHSTLGPNVKVVAYLPLVDVEEDNDEADDPPISSPNTERKNSPSSSDNKASKKMKDPAAKRITLNLLIAKYLYNNREILDGIAREVQATATLVDWNNGIIELFLNDPNASPDELESAVTRFHSLVSSTVCRADIHFPPEACNEATKTIINFSSMNNLPVDFTKDNCVGIVGRVNQIRDLEDIVRNLCDHIVQASDQISFTHEDFIYISGKYTMKEVTKTHPNVKIEMDGVTNVMSVSGSKHDVSRFKESLNDFASHVTVPVQVTKLAIQFLKDGKGAGILQTLIKCDSVIPFFSKDLFADHSLSLLCPHTDAQHAENVSSTISVTIVEKNFNNFPQYFFTDVADSPQFNNFKQKMSNKYAFHCAVERNGMFKLVCREEVQQQLSDLFCKFVAEECSITERIQMKRGVWRLFNSSMQKKWNKLETEMMENGIRVLSKSKPTASKPYLKIKGDRNTVAQTKEKFMELQKSVHELKFTVARPGVVQHFYKDPHGRVSLTGVETTAKVCIELEVQQEDDSETEPTTPTGQSSSFKKVCTANIQGISVNLYVGDITKFNRAEVIVNAANEHLAHGSGVAGAIVDRGGPDIIKDSQDYVNKKGKVATGSAVIFRRVGNLPSPYQAIVHAVGPMWSSYGGSDSKDRNIALLRKTVKNSLKQAKSFNSIAIPAISSGVYGFPIDIAANSLIQGVVEFMTNNSDSYNLSDINFVIYDDNVAAFKKAIKEHLHNVHMFDEAQPSSITKTTPKTSQSSPQMSLRTRRRASSKMDTLNRIKITKDDILKHQCEVLVNTTDQQLGFGGFVGRVLLKAAGPGLQNECQAIPKPIQYGDTVTTKAHQLESKHIVHVVLPGYSGSDSETALKGVVNKCLQECTRLNAKSISIPSIGAGNLGYPSDVVAMCLLEEAFRYLSDNDGHTSLQSIHFVVFDGAVHQAFQQYYSQMPKSRANSTSNLGSVAEVITSHSSPTAKMKTTGATPIPTLRKKKPAKKPISLANNSRLSDANSCSFALPNDIRLHLIQGDITDERTDVIVNTTNPELKLSGGGVSGALLRKGGLDLQNACDRTRASNMKAAEGKVVETRCEGIGQLRCKSIFHIVFEGKDQRKLVKTILACLDRAEKMKYTSIAIPAIGTGIVAYPSALAADGIVKALKQFMQRKPNHVKEIRMVIFMPNMFKEFTDAFKKIKEENGPEGILNYIYDKGSQLLETVNSFFNPSGDEELDSQSDEDPDKMDWTTTTRAEDSDSDDEDNEESEDDGFEHIGGLPMDEHMLSSISLDAAITMFIFGESEQAVKRAKKKLESLIDTLIVNEEVVDPNICELSSAALSDLKEFAHQQSVDIDIDNDPVLHSIKLHGCTNDVLKVKDKIRDALSHVHQFKAKQEVASTVRKHVKWVRQLSDGPEDYDEVLSLEIEQAFLKKKPSYRHNGDIEKFTIDFSKMEETDLDNEDKVKVSRVDFAEDEKPSDWIPMPKDSNGREATVHLETLKTSDAEYKDALSQFDATMMKSNYNQLQLVSIQRIQNPSYTQIVSIQRIQNPVLYGQYMARKKEMEKRNPPKCQNERWLFHGTKPAVIDAINTQGLNRSFKSTTIYGQGVYFARDASYSHGYTQPDPFNHRHMYLARVLTGEFAVGKGSMLVPPAKNNQQNQHILFDSTVDSTVDPSIFVVYTDSQAYAAYLITYK